MTEPPKPPSKRTPRTAQPIFDILWEALSARGYIPTSERDGVVEWQCTTPIVPRITDIPAQYQLGPGHVWLTPQGSLLVGTALTEARAPKSIIRAVLVLEGTALLRQRDLKDKFNNIMWDGTEPQEYDDPSSGAEPHKHDPSNQSKE